MRALMVAAGIAALALLPHDVHARGLLAHRLRLRARARRVHRRHQRAAPVRRHAAAADAVLHLFMLYAALPNRFWRQVAPPLLLSAGVIVAAC